jgi:hypothetical protein
MLVNDVNIKGCKLFLVMYELCELCSFGSCAILIFITYFCFIIDLLKK